VAFRGCSFVDQPNNDFCDSLGLDPDQNVVDGFAGNYNCSDRSFFGYPPNPFSQGLCTKFTCNGSGENSITPEQRGPLTEQCEACFAPPPTSTTTVAPPDSTTTVATTTTTGGDTPFSCPADIPIGSVGPGGNCCEQADCIQGIELPGRQSFILEHMLLLFYTLLLTHFMYCLFSSNLICISKTSETQCPGH